MLEGTVPSSWSNVKTLSLLRLNGNNLSGDVEDVVSGMKKLQVLTVSCQGDKVRGVIPCNRPFDLSSEAILRVAGRLQNLSVIDVQNETAVLDTVSFWEDQAAEQPVIESRAAFWWGISLLF